MELSKTIKQCIHIMEDNASGAQADDIEQVIV